MNFKQWLLSEEIYPQNKTATVFHRTCSGCDENQSINSVAGILTSDFKAGSSVGCHYGCGLYTTFALQSQFVGGMTSKYGQAVIKFKVTNLDNYLIFQTSVAKAIHGKDYKLTDQLKKFGVLNKVSPDTNLPEIEQELLYKPFSGDIAKSFYDKNRWMEKSLKGIILRGRNDGFVLVKYEPVQDGTITMLGYAVAKDNDFEKMKELGANNGWIKSTNFAAMKNIYNLPQEKRSQYKFASNPFIDILLKADPKTYEFLGKKYKTEIENLSDDDVLYLLQNATDIDRIAELIINKKQKLLSDRNVSYLLAYANNKDKMAEIIINKKPKLSDDNVKNLLDYVADKDKFAEIIIEKKPELSDRNVYYLLHFANDKDKIAKLLQKETDNLSKLQNDDFKDLLHFATDQAKDKMAEIIIKYKKEITDNDVEYLLHFAKDKETIAERIIEKKPELTDNVKIHFAGKTNNQDLLLKLAENPNLSYENVRYLLDYATNKDGMTEIIIKYKKELSDDIINLLLRAKDKDKIAELIIKYKPELTDKNVFHLLFHATDIDKIAKLIIEKKQKLLSNHNVFHLLDREEYEDIDGIAELIIKYKKELTDDNVRDLLKKANDKDKIAEIIIKYKKELSNNNVEDLLDYANDTEKIAERLQKETDNISKLSDLNVENLLRGANDKPKMAQILNKYHQNKTPKMQRWIDKYLQ